MIDRYSLSSPYEDSEMVGDPDGDWVEYEEYAKLLEMYQHLTAANGDLADAAIEKPPYKADLVSALESIIQIEDREWKPMQVFRSDEEVLCDERRHDLVIEIADICREALKVGEDQE